MPAELLEGPLEGRGDGRAPTRRLDEKLCEARAALRRRKNGPFPIDEYKRAADKSLDFKLRAGTKVRILTGRKDGKPRLYVVNSTDLDGWQVTFGAAKSIETVKVEESSDMIEVATREDGRTVTHRFHYRSQRPYRLEIAKR